MGYCRIHLILLRSLDHSNFQSINTLFLNKLKAQSLEVQLQSDRKEEVEFSDNKGA